MAGKVDEVSLTPIFHFEIGAKVAGRCSIECVLSMIAVRRQTWRICVLSIDLFATSRNLHSLITMTSVEARF